MLTYDEKFCYGTKALCTRAVNITVFVSSTFDLFLRDRMGV